jgi:hypothetical protein
MVIIAVEEGYRAAREVANGMGCGEGASAVEKLWNVEIAAVCEGFAGG